MGTNLEDVTTSQFLIGSRNVPTVEGASEGSHSGALVTRTTAELKPMQVCKKGPNCKSLKEPHTHRGHEESEQL